MILWYHYVLIALAALAAGFVNALAGGGTLITFPALTAVGIPAVAANVTNTVALCPGYLGAVLAQWKEIKAQKKRLLLFVPAGILGGVLGGALLLLSGEKIFAEIVPFLILFACAMLAVADPIRTWVTRRIEARGQTVNPSDALAIFPVLLASTYGGYFGAGASIIILAVLGLVITDTLTNLNALKQAISFSINVAAAIFFLFSGQVVWWAALVMSVFALLGGMLGGKLAGKVKPKVLRWLVVGIGTLVAIIYLIK